MRQQDTKRTQASRKTLQFTPRPEEHHNEGLYYTSVMLGSSVPQIYRGSNALYDTAGGQMSV